MRFKYKKYGTDSPRPVVPVVLRHGTKMFQHEALVDSGADINVVSAEISSFLGIDIKSGQEGRIRGATGRTEKYFMHTVELLIGGHKITTPVAFAENVGQDGYGI